MAEEIKKDGPTGPTGPAKPVKENDSETVPVPKKTLSELLARLDKLEKSDEAKGNELLMLRTVADAGRVYNFERKNKKGELIRTARLMTEGEGKDQKIVVGWKMVKNSSFVDNLGIPHIDQTITLFYDNGEGTPTQSEPIPYSQFSRNDKRIEGDIVNRNENEETGILTFTVQLKDGRRLDVGEDFINP